MEMPETISLYIAFLAGLLSFVSPCVLPLVPSYISYITGLSVDELSNREGEKRIKGITITNSLMFIFGFSTIFILFGASATFIGQVLVSYQGAIRKIGGLIIIVFGLYIMGILKLNFLMSEKRIHIQNKPAGHIGSFLVGIGFAAGWTPCVGPILGTILLYASTENSILKGIQLLSFYSLGLGLPLLIISLGIDAFLYYFKKLHKYMWMISFISGLFLLIVGIMIFTNSFTMVTAFLTKHGIGWYIGQ
ncbi:MAG: cytochrome c biogenesis CcdA family protein [Nitrospirota bacterium]